MDKTFNREKKSPDRVTGFLEVYRSHYFSPWCHMILQKSFQYAAQRYILSKC